MYYFQCMEAHQLLMKVHHYYRWRTSGPYQDIQWMWTNVSFVIFICESAIVGVIFIIRWWVRVSMWVSVHVLVCHSNVIRNTDHIHRTLLRHYNAPTIQTSEAQAFKGTSKKNNRNDYWAAGSSAIRVRTSASYTLHFSLQNKQLLPLYKMFIFTSMQTKIKTQIKKRFQVWIQTISFLQS